MGAKPSVAGERGLPKPAIPVAELSERGVAGDFNLYRTREKASDPGMAVLLLPFETIETLQKEGWPVRPGDLGENITTRGLAYDTLSPGSRWTVGGAMIEITKACTPCDNLWALPYVGTARGPQFVRTMIGRRGWFARVLTPGRVRPGDRIAPAPA